MLEAYTALGFIAAHTRRAEILAWVTAAVYRDPGLLAKQISTLDVLSGGRAMLGLGAGWNEQECVGLGLPFPPVAERFERLEETLQICRQMFSDSEEPFRGKHYQLGRTLNVPQPLRRVPILIGGGGEKKTLRMVAQYADACNLFDIPALPEKLDILRGHCERLGRDYGEIEKTVMSGIDLDREPVPQLLQRLRRLADLGVAQVHSHVANVCRDHPAGDPGERGDPGDRRLVDRPPRVRPTRPDNRSRSPDARSAGRATASLIASSVPAMRTKSFARVTAV